MPDDDATDSIRHLDHLDLGRRWPVTPGKYQTLFLHGGRPRVLLVTGIPGPDTSPTPVVADLIDRLAQAAFPVIAIVDGPLDGAGAQLALTAHWRIGTPAVVFRCSPGSIFRPPRLAFHTGADRLLALMLTGGAITAEEALAWGLLQHLAERGAAHQFALGLATRLATLSASSIRLVSEALRDGAGLPLAAALALETRLFVEALHSPDAREGVRAFFEKRPPRFASPN